VLGFPPRGRVLADPGCSSSAAAGSPAGAASASASRSSPRGAARKLSSTSTTSRGRSSPRSCSCRWSCPSPSPGSLADRAQGRTPWRPRARAGREERAWSRWPRRTHGTTFDERQRTPEEMRWRRCSVCRPPAAPAASPAIECFDISTFQGQLTVGFRRWCSPTASLTRAATGWFKVRGEAAGDDFRFHVPGAHAAACSAGIEQQDLPDLLLVDGGKGSQASRAAR